MTVRPDCEGAKIFPRNESESRPDSHLFTASAVKFVEVHLHICSKTIICRLKLFIHKFKVMMSHKETPKEARPPNGFCLMLFHDSISVMRSKFRSSSSHWEKTSSSPPLCIPRQLCSVCSSASFPDWFSASLTSDTCPNSEKKNSFFFQNLDSPRRAVS